MHLNIADQYLVLLLLFSRTKIETIRIAIAQQMALLDIYKPLLYNQYPP